MTTNLIPRLAVNDRDLSQYLADLPNHGYTVKPMTSQRWALIDAYGEQDATVILRGDGTFFVRPVR